MPADSRSESSPTPRASRPILLLLALLLAALGGAAAGCGSSHSTGTSADPAVAVPAAAPLYAGASVRPRDPQRTDALAAGRALTGQANPYLRLTGALQTPGSPALDFKRDLAPWLGPHAGVYLASLAGAQAVLSLLQQGLLGGGGGFPFGADGAQGAFVLDTTDAAKTRAFLDRQARRAGAHPTSYRGVAYQVSGEGAAFALVDRFAAIGSETGVRGVIDTALGGAALAHAAPYATLLASAPARALAHVYASPQASAAAGAGGGFSSLLGLASGGRPLNVSLVPTKSSIALDADTLAPSGGAQGGEALGSSAGLLASGSQASKAYGELPGEAWLALGLGEVARLVGQARGLSSLGSLLGAGQRGEAQSGLNVKGLLEGLLQPLAALGASSPQARRELAGWMGSGGAFAAGSGLLELKAAVVIDSNDAARSRAAVQQLGAALRRGGSTLQPVTIPGTEAAVGAKVQGLPLVLDIAAGRSAAGQAKFVLGLGEASVQGALNPSSTLAGSQTFTGAATALGEGIQPSLSFDFPTFVGLLEGVGLTEDPTLSKVVPYLRRLTTLSGGARKVANQVERFRLVLGLRPAGG